MGSNQVALVERYLSLKAELLKAEEEKDNHKAEVIQAEMTGMVKGYELYVSSHWNTFENLIKDYNRYMRK